MRKFMTGVSTIFALALLASVAFAADKANFQDGLWEITTTMKMDGMPMGPQTTTIKECMNSSNPVPQPKEKDNSCKMDNLSTSGNTVSWTMTCNNKDGKMESTGKMTYADRKSFEGTQDMKMTTGKGKPMSMHSTMKGKYLSACPTGK